MVKIIFLVIVVLIFAFNITLKISDYLSKNNPIPKNVEDVYDSQSYDKYKHYLSDNTKFGIISDSISFLITVALIFSPLLPYLSNKVDGNYYINALVIEGVYVGINEIMAIIFSYYVTFTIEEKYGFNKTTKKTFISDKIKEIILTFGIMYGLTALFILLHQALGDYIIIVFAAILFIIILFVNFLSPVLSKIFYKFERLEDGSLRDKLTHLLESHNFTVKDIKVMKASERSTKSNAYFTGFSKSKTIVLYDTLLSDMEEDEIVSVFAHEMGHGLHKDTLKNNFINLLLIALLSACLFITVKFPCFFEDFGFTSISYGFALVLMLEVEAPFIMPLLSVLSAALSRKAEYAADKQAVIEGYGKELISALKKLSRSNMANLSPNRLNILLEYTHPTISQRIEQIEKEMNNK